MLTHRGFTAWVTCDGKSLYEFKPVVNSDTNKVTCWIPSEPGKRFTVHWKDHGSLVDTASYIYLDGYMVPGYFLFGFGEASRGAMRVGPTMERPFVFAEADQEFNPSKSSADAGTIVLRIRRIKRTTVTKSNVPRPTPPKSSGVNDSSVVTSFGDKQPSSMQMPSTWDVEPLDPKEPPFFVTFEWRYRTMRYLVANSIAHMDSAIARTKPQFARAISASTQQSTPPMTPASQMRQSLSPTSGSNPSPNGSTKRLRIQAEPMDTSSEEGHSQGSYHSFKLSEYYPTPTASRGGCSAVSSQERFD